MKPDKRKLPPEILKHMESCAIFLIKTLCIEPNATSAELQQTLTHYGKSIGRYKITIEKK